MALLKPIKIAVCVVFAVLYMIASLNWLISTINYKNQWECYLCDGDDKGPVSIKQQFLYFSVWSLWFSIAVFVGWMMHAVLSRGNGTILDKIGWVALPLIMTVFVSYVYYDATNSVDGFINKEACYVMRKSAESKRTTSNKTIIDILLAMEVITDFTIHYLSAPLMILLLVSGEIKYTAPIRKPVSTLFLLVLGIVVYFGQSFGSIVYCGSALFNSGMTTLISLAIHCILVACTRFYTRSHEQDGKVDTGKKGDVAKDAVGDIPSGEHDVIPI